jgi:tetratricopeptide (TPR) repeat protein
MTEHGKAGVEEAVSQPAAGHQVGESAAVNIAIDAIADDPDLKKKAVAFLEAQTDLAYAHRHRVESEHNFFEKVEKGAKKLALRGQSAAKLAVLSAIMGSVIGFFWLLVSAATSHCVVVEPIKVSSNIATLMPDGTIVSGMLIARLDEMQRRSHTSLALHADLSSAWNSEAQIEIPEAGISLNELRSFLNRSLGRNVYLEGDIAEFESGKFRLTVHGSGIPARGFDFARDQLEGAVRAASEYLYGEAEPELFAYFLGYALRLEDAIEFSRTHLTGTSGHLRAALEDDWAIALFGLVYFDPEKTQQLDALWRAAIKDDPEHLFSYQDYATFKMVGGRHNEATKICDEMYQRMGRRPSRAQLSHMMDCRREQKDWNGYLEAIDADQAEVSGGDISFPNLSLERAMVLVRLRDLDGAAEVLGSNAWNSSSDIELAAREEVLAEISEQHGDWPTAVDHWKRFLTLTTSATSLNNESDFTRRCRAADAFDRVGDRTGALTLLDDDARIFKVPPIPECEFVRGAILARHGDFAGAERVVIAGLKNAATIPDGYLALGLIHLEQNKLEAAVADFRKATEYGPHWADPYKYLGDSLRLLGRKKEAAEAYQTALKYAPKWPELIRDSRLL